MKPRLPTDPAGMALTYIGALMAVILIIAVTFGCAPTKTITQIVPQEVRVPVPVYCNVDTGPAIIFPDTPGSMAGVPDVFTGTKYLKAGRVLRDARIRELEAALEACSQNE